MKSTLTFGKNLRKGKRNENSVFVMSKLSLLIKGKETKSKEKQYYSRPFVPCGLRYDNRAALR